MSSKPTIFLLGATGYVGGEILSLLSKSCLPPPRDGLDSEGYRVVALVRNVTPEREAALKRLYGDLEIVQGTLDDEDVIKEAAERADVVVSCAVSIHGPSIKAVLAGLTARSEADAGASPPILVHVSGITIIADDANGEEVANVKEWSDLDLDITKLPRTSAHMNCEIPIAEAGTRTENPIRTFVLYAGLIYGIGDGIQRTTAWLGPWIQHAKDAGFSGTYGPGANALSHIHVRDVAAAVLTVLRAALKGEVRGGKGCNYFVAISKTEQRAWAKVVGDCLYSKKIVQEPGCRPWPESITRAKGTAYWRVFGGNQIVRPDRLYALGWEPVETKKQSLVDSLPQAIDLALE